MARVVAMGVREFALPVPRTGSIETHSGYGPVPQQGAEIHVAFQATRTAQNPDYKAEYPLTATFERGNYRFRVAGRADGFFDSPLLPIVEEIKSAFDAPGLLEKLAARPDHPYRLQLLTYAYFHYKRTGVVPQARLVVVSSRTREASELDLTLDVAAYEAWLALRLDELVVEEAAIRARVKRRKRVAAGLVFPFAAPRPGQAELMDLLAKDGDERRHALIQAPTGMGKTLGIMLPTLREAMARGSALLYITPKNSQHHVAENAVRQLQRVKGPTPRALTLTAKSRICMKGEPLCNPEHCEFARDYYAKVAEHKLVDVVGRRKVVTDSTLKKLATKYEVCPHELSLDAAPHFDVVIGDYNYVIQPHGLMARIEAKLRGKSAQPNLVIDEAHNLFPRANDNLSTVLSRRALEDLAAALQLVPADFAREGRAVAAAGIAALQASEGTARVEGGQAVVAKIDQIALNDVTLRSAAFVTKYLASGADVLQGDPVLKLAGYWANFAAALAGAVASGMGTVQGAPFVSVFERGGGDERLRIICCDASKPLAESFASFARVVGFSATLKPFSYYAQLSGFDGEKVLTAEFATPFPRSNRKLMVIPQVSTKFRDRQRYVDKIAEAIVRVVAVKPGNYVAFFPSFQFLGDTAARIEAPGFRVVRQKPAMSRGEINECIAALRDGVAPTLLLAVQGGGLAEGVDFPGEQLIGAIIVGPALPGYDVPREILRDYYERRYGQGTDYAYTYPAMAKVIQAAGRVIRTETDRGLIVLMDRRFVEPRYSALLPRDWYDESVHELVSKGILRDVAAFWEGGADDAAH